jgi:hypothetical protein
MRSPKILTARGPERIIQDQIIQMLTIKGWLVKETHGNMFQSGFPDLFAAKRNMGSRWIEVKNPTKYKFTPAQMDDFPKFGAAGVGIWILTAATEHEYNKLFQPANWYSFLSIYK